MATIRRVSSAKTRMAMASRMSALSCAAGLIAASGVVGVRAERPAGAQSTPGPAYRSLVNRYCVSRHSERLSRGSLALEAAAAEDVGGHPEVWETVVRKLRVPQVP